MKEVLSHISVKDFDPEEDVIRVERKGKRNDKLGTVFVKISNQGLKSEIMKKKKELADKPDDKLKRLKIMNFKNQEQILFENALRQVLSIMPNGHQYELNGSMKNDRQTRTDSEAPTPTVSHIPNVGRVGNMQ